ncbi:unnamed protein product [Caenorhabditis nigoni]|uniref:Uncharacterized protein n=1 Tax=Caenorhabditis nigoni TaxID=1611254 RepID=A0A2G5V8G1_9PELO|nr:hypothetical protein B9Z55_007191 [Caenorhabditis nigoni]
MENVLPVQEARPESLLARLLSQPVSPPRAVRRIIVPESDGRRPERITPVVNNYFPPNDASFNYNEWTKFEIKEFLDQLIHDKMLVHAIMCHGITGSALYSCFLHEEMSENFRRTVGYSPGVAMKLRMALGNIHNEFYGV